MTTEGVIFNQYFLFSHTNTTKILFMFLLFIWSFLSLMTCNIPKMIFIPCYRITVTLLVLLWSFLVSPLLSIVHRVLSNSIHADWCSLWTFDWWVPTTEYCYFFPTLCTCLTLRAYTFSLPIYHTSIFCVSDQQHCVLLAFSCLPSHYTNNIHQIYWH
jgi:hypothetical protein